jgi:hypothetical protein
MAHSSQDREPQNAGASPVADAPDPGGAPDQRLCVERSVSWPTVDELRELIHQYTVGRARLFKVRQPWAGLLVLGVKDVENRSYRLADCDGLWLIVVSSMSAPSRDMNADMHRRLGHARLADADAVDTRGRILGAVRLRGSAQTVDSVWHNPLDWGWLIDRAIRFQTPIALSPDDRFQIQVSSEHRPQYLGYITQAIEVLMQRDDF